jgi:hypothetical protein
VTGLEVHFIVVSETNTLAVRYLNSFRELGKLQACRWLGMLSSDSYSFSISLSGKLDNPYHWNQPNVWAVKLLDFATDMSELFTRENGSTWSPQSNCQHFCRFLCSKLDVPWPEDVVVASDVAPIVIDLASLVVTTSRAH